MRVTLVPLSEVLGLVPLPLLEEIITADVSPCGNEGAWESDVGGGWASKNARCGKRGSVMISRSGKLEGIYVWGFTVFELRPRASQETGYTFFRRPRKS